MNMLLGATTVLNWLDFVVIFALVVVALLVTGRFHR